MTSTLRERRRQATRQAILEAALALTRANGAHGWTMRELADRIDFTTTATYRYFASRDDVLRALVEDAFTVLRADLDRAVESAPQGSSPVETVLRLGLAYLDFARANPTEFRLAFVESPSGRSSLEQRPAPQSPYVVLLDAVEEAVRSGDFATTDAFGPEQITYTIWSTVHGMAVLETTHLQDFDADVQGPAEHGIRRLLAGLAETGQE
jgi:AcrR family transcriptional regulator